MSKYADINKAANEFNATNAINTEIDSCFSSNGVAFHIEDEGWSVTTCKLFCLREIMEARGNGKNYRIVPA